jgi:hypothetical protein
VIRDYSGTISVRCARRWGRGAAFLRDIHASRHVRKPQLRRKTYRCASYINRGVSLSDSPQEQNPTFGLLPTMDNVIFYQPPSASTSHPLHLPGALTASIVPRGSVAAIPVQQTTSQHNQRNEIWKDHIIKYRDMSDPSQKRYSPDQSCRNDTVQKQGTCGDCFHNYCA